MALSKITYDNKQTLIDQPSIAEINKCTSSNMNEIKSVVNTGIDVLNGDGVMGDITCENIQTQNMFDKRTIVAGDITGAFNDIRLSSRQPLWLEAGTYTFSSNVSSPIRIAVDIESVGVPPLSSYPTYIQQSGWKSASELPYTFTTTQAGWCIVNVSKENNASIAVSDIASSNFKLEKGSTATTYSSYQSLDYEEPIIDITKQITWKSGFELKDGILWKQGKRIFGTLNIGGTWTTGTQVIDVFTIPYSFPTNFIFGCTATTRDQWGYPDGMAYCYMSQWGHFNVNTNINAKFIRVQFEFITN